MFLLFLLYHLQCLRRGRTADRATSPLRESHPSPALHLVSYSVGCQTSTDEVESPKEITSTFCQTDEEVIPPKILMSAASQTDLYMPVEVGPEEVRTALQTGIITPADVMAVRHVPGTAPVQLQSPSQSTQAPNLLQTANNQSAQYYQMPPGRRPQQTFSFRPTQQGEPQGPVNALAGQLRSPIRTLLQRPTAVPQTGGFQSTGYHSGGLNSTQIRTSQPSTVRHYTPVSSTVESTGEYHLNARRAYVSAFNSLAQRNSASQSQMTNQAVSSYRGIAQSDSPVQHVGRHLATQQQMPPSRTLQQTVDAQAALQLRIRTAMQEANQRQTAEVCSSRNTFVPLGNVSSSQVTHQQGISHPEIQVHAQALIRRNPPYVSHNQQGANVGSSINHAAVHGPVALSPSMSGLLQTQGSQVLGSQAANLNSSANQTAMHGVQQSRSQPTAINAQSHAERSLAQDHRGVSLNSSLNQSSALGMPMQQSVMQPMTVNSGVHTQRVSQNQQERNLPMSQIGVSEVAVQQTAQSPSLPGSVQTRSSNSYSKTMTQFRQMVVERNLAVSKTQQRTRFDARNPSLYDEVRRVYKQLQHSLDEVTLNKEKERNAHVTNSTSVTADSVLVDNSGSSEMRAGYLQSSNESHQSSSTFVSTSENVASEEHSLSQACDSGETDFIRSCPSDGLQTTVGSSEQDSVKEQMTCLSRNKDPCKNPRKKTIGALENTVQRLLALQNNPSPSDNDSRCSSPNSVDELFDGTSKNENWSEPLQLEPETSDERNVSLLENNSGNEFVQDCSNIPERGTLEAASLGVFERASNKECEKQVDPPEAFSNSPEEIGLEKMKPVAETTSSCEESDLPRVKEVGDSLMADGEDEKEVVRGTEDSTVSNLDSVFIAPLPPSKTKGGSEKNRDSNSDDLYVDLMSPVIPNGTENNSVSNLDSVFVAPKTPSKTRSKGEKDNDPYSDDLYVDLMSPIIPPIVTAKRNWSRFLRFDSHTASDDADDEQDGDDVVGDVESNPKPARTVSETEEAAKGTDITDPEYSRGRVEMQQPVMETANQENVKDDPEFAPRAVDMEGSKKDGDKANKGMKTDAEPTESITEMQQAVANVDVVEPGEENGLEFALSAVEMEESVEDGDKANEGMETCVNPKQSIAETQQAVADVEGIEPVEGNDNEFAQNTIEMEESVEDGDKSKESMGSDAQVAENTLEMEESVKGGDKTGEGMETDAEPEQSIAEMQQAVASVDRVDLDVENDPEFAPDALGTGKPVKNGHIADEDMETDADPKQSIAETQQVMINVDSVDPDLQNDPEFAKCTVEPRDSAKGGDIAGEDMETDPEPKQSIAATQEAVTNVDNFDPGAENDPEFSPNSVETGKSVKDGGRAVEDIEKDEGPKEGTAETQQALTNVEIVDPDSANDPEFSSIVFETEQSVKDGDDADDDVETRNVDLVVENDLTPTSRGTETEEAVAKADASNADLGPSCTIAAIEQTDIDSQCESGSPHSEELCANTDCDQQKSVVNVEGIKQPQKPGLALEAIAEQNLYHLSSTVMEPPTVSEFTSVFHVSRKISDIEGTKRHPLEDRLHCIPSHTISSPLERRDSNIIVDHNDKENASTSEPVERNVNVSSIPPSPRLAVRLLNEDLVIMWDLPPDNSVTDIEYFELYSWSSVGQWLRIAQIKALKLPMGCTLRNLVPGKMFFFTVRAVGRNGEAGDFSPPSGVNS